MAESAVVNQAEGRAVAIRRVLELAPLPLVAQRLLDDLAAEDSSILRLAGIIEMDPGLTARIVGMANSAYFSPSSPVYSVADAINRVLGLNMVRSMALGVALSGPFDVRRCRGLHLDRYWFVAMATAWLGRNLAPHLHGEPPLSADQVHLCGMLHNFGLLVLASLWPQEMSGAFATAEREGTPVSVQERRLIGIDHHEAGGVLARKWHLPAAVVTVVERHACEPQEDAHDDRMCALVGLASRTSHAVWQGRPPEIPAAILRRSGIDEEKFTAGLGRLVTRAGELQSLAGQMARF